MSTHASAQQAHRRTDLVYALGVLVALGVLLWIVLTMQSLTHDLRTSNDARDALARQVQQLGGKPIAGPPGSRGAPGQSVTGARGPQGEPGKDAPTVAPSPGASGVPGKAGKDGKDGADSIVPGPSGPPGRDATGAPGQDGKDGKDGQDGTDGSPPAGWSYTDPQGVQYTCSPVADFDPSAPRYTCTAASAPSPQSRKGGLLGLGLLTMTASYRRLGA